jgi:hypothetical protein
MHKYQRPVTPADITGPLSALIQELVPDGVAKYVDVKPEKNADLNDCFPLVKERVASSGGKQLFGWALWELPYLFVEAEFHSVWQKTDGSLVDVTPKLNSSDKVLFLHDPNITYKGKQVNNIRKKLRQLPILDEYFETFNEEYRLLNRGERANQHGEITLKDNERKEYHFIQQKRAMCFIELQRLFPYATPYTPCPCGSGKKIKWCHKDYAK